MEKIFSSSKVATSLKELSEGFLTHLLVPICLIHKDFKVSYTNQSFLDLVGDNFMQYLSEDQKNSLFEQDEQIQFVSFKNAQGEICDLKLEIKKIIVSKEELRLIQLVEQAEVNKNVLVSRSVRKDDFELGIWVWEVGKQRVIRSREILKVYELDSSQKEVTLEEHLSFYSADIRKKVEKKLNAIAEGKFKEEFEEIILTPKGNLRFLKTKVILKDTLNPKNKKITFSSIDITAYKLSEKKLTEQKRLLQESLNLTDNLYKLEREFVLGKIENRGKIYKSFLDTIVSYTSSEFGFLAEVTNVKSDTPSLKIYAASDQIYNALNIKYKSSQIIGVEFNKSEELYKHTLKTGKALIVNSPVEFSSDNIDSSITSYISVPIHKNDELVGIISVANGKNLYSEITIKRIKPFISSLLLMIEFSRLEEQRKEQEKTIRQNEERLEKIFDVLNAPILICDPNTFKFKFFNQNVVKKLGYSAEELYQMTLFDFEENVDASNLQEHIKTVLRKKTVEFNTKWKTKKGEGIEVLLKTSRIVLGEKEYVLFAGYDITRQAEVYLALKEEQKRFKELFESVPVGILTANSEGKITTCNSICAEMFGYSQEEISSVSVNDLIANNFSREKHQALMEGYLEKPESRKMLASARGVVGKKKNGDKIPVEVSLSHFDTGGVRQVIAIITDISEKEKAFQTKRMLDERETLLKEIHHRVKNNMQVISSLLSLQAAKITDPEALLKFKESEIRIKSMALIHEKLYESDSLTEINVKEYLEDLIEHVVGSYTLSNKIRLVKEIEQITLNIEQCIPFGLIVNEFLTNALKYAFIDKKDGIIKVVLQESDKGITLVVKDNGVGFLTPIEEKKTLGIRLIKSLTKQLRGTFSQENENGAKCSLFFERQDS